MISGYRILQGFRFNIILRVLILVSLCIALGVVITNYNWLFTPLVIAILIIIVTLNLIYYLEGTNRGIVTFLTSLRQKNFTNQYTSKEKGKTFEQLEVLFQDINNSFLEISLDKESHYQYLQALTENIGVGIISYLEDGKIQLYNPAAKNIFKKPFLQNIKDLRNAAPEVYDQIEALQNNGGAVVVQTAIAKTIFNLSIVCRKFKAQDIPFYVVLIQDIKRELDEKESTSWQKLVKVLTHEIMNSATPIASLSGAVNSFIKNNALQDLNDEDVQDLLTSLDTIENRSKGMVKFVNSYKEYARDLTVNKQRVIAADLIAGVKNLVQPQIDQQHIDVRISIVPESLVLSCDKGLLEQVLINLIKNAMEAIMHQPKPTIRISITQEDSMISITIADNGPGIEPDILENIFVPFFTTKRGGSGVGLSLSKRILQLHGGDIQVQTAGTGTTFTVSIPA